MERFLYNAEHKLRQFKTRNPLLIFRNDGYSARVAKTVAVKTYSSGPRGGMEGAKAFAAHYGLKRLLTMDIGGTTTDIGLIDDGSVRSHRRGMIQGVPISFPLCDVVSAGVGGSSIIKVDGGRIRVGPESVGSAPGPVVVCGESAGGNLAAVTCLRLRSNPRVAIRYQVLLQPVVDFTLSFPSIAMPSTECLVPREDLAWYYRTYRGDQCDPRDPRVSPIYAQDLSRLPPALIIAAEYDTLRDEAEAYAERLKTAGIATRYICADGMVHGFLQMRGIVPDAQIATEEIARALS